jgi:hypothetical protein
MQIALWPRLDWPSRRASFGPSGQPSADTLNARLVRRDGHHLLLREQERHVLGISLETAKVHVKHLLGTLAVRDRAAAVTNALQRGIIHLDD